MGFWGATHGPTSPPGPSVGTHGQQGYGCRSQPRQRLGTGGARLPCSDLPELSRNTGACVGCDTSQHGSWDWERSRASGPEPGGEVTLLPAPMGAGTCRSLPRHPAPRRGEQGQGGARPRAPSPRDAVGSRGDPGSPLPPLTLKPSRLGKTLWILTTSSLEPGSWKHFLAFTSFSVVSGVILYCIP